ncbi:hypothetical protein PAXRUDRAFT_823278 [Paxillus rubicundulus Ve08.2h10]|uniref:Uncharacterized protein n=1 Tax=Paxillus rubicundulus Ve08.2h10 TaxID=930991 RepID=A0A0D0EC86_9AGAM|nr:hypothetical protein PAXRUDRAFT_823278 [Paxillus rubicundulus Ve08.2h10]
MSVTGRTPVAAEGKAGRVQTGLEGVLNDGDVEATRSEGQNEVADARDDGGLLIVSLDQYHWLSCRLENDPTLIGS